MTLLSLQGLVDDLVRDKDQVISTSSRDEAIAQAVIRYSADRARVVLVDVVAVAGGRALDLPAGWEAGYSQLDSVEYPVDEYPASNLPMAEVRMRRTPTGERIELPIELPAGATVRLGYTQRHVVDAGTDTLPDSDRLAVACWAAALICGQLQAYYATESMPSIQADVADHQGKSDRWRTRARDLAARYYNILGIEEKRSTAASTVTSMRGTDSQGNPRLYHNRRYRDGR